MAQAARAAELLRDRGIRSIVSSTLSRARDTAERVAGVLGLPIRFDDALRECAFGVQEGQPMADWFDDWVEGRMVPEGAESFADLRLRAVAAVNRALEGEPPVLVVGHGAVFRALRARGPVPVIMLTAKDGEVDKVVGLAVAVFSAMLSSLFTIINSRFAQRLDAYVISFYEMAGASAGRAGRTTTSEGFCDGPFMKA